MINTTPISNPRLGLIVRCDNTGLGYQTLDQFRHLNPQKTLVVDYSAEKGNKAFPERYPATDGVVVVKGVPTDSDVTTFLDDLDIVLTTETTYNQNLCTLAHARGVRVVLLYNAEFLALSQHPEQPKPDLLLAPSDWLLQETIVEAKELSVAIRRIDVPVDRTNLPFTKRTQLKTFLHLSGNATHEDRNGTELLLAAVPFVKNPNFQLTIHTQHTIIGNPDRKRVTIVMDTPEWNWQQYDGQDALLMPRRYGGLCLPRNEALSLGMIPIMLDCSPNKEDGLLDEWLVKSELYTIFTSVRPIHCYKCTPQDLATKIDWLMEQGTETVGEWSEYANKLAEYLDWDYQLPMWRLMFDQAMKHYSADTTPQQRAYYKSLGVQGL